MHDINFIRNNPELFDAGLVKRGAPPQAEVILALDEEKRHAITRLQELQARKNELAKAIGQAKGKGEDATALLKESGEVKEATAALETQLQGEDMLQQLLETLPNLAEADVPEGEDESSNKELRLVGEKPAFGFAPKQHFELGEALGQLDFSQAATISGARFAVLSGQLARLERALAAFMLDIQTQEYGFEEVSPPLLVRNTALYGTGQLPKFKEDLFEADSGHFLIPTGEVPLTNLVAGKILGEEELPLRYTACTPCFRSEAGAAGRDTRGLIRQHQFSKVELVSIARPEDSAAEQERMLAAAEEVLKRLGLHYRVMLLCAGDMGFSAKKTYDIEVWLPGQEAYREISSVSNCGDFQARRMKARYRRAGEKATTFVHSLNGSGLAVGRTLVAVLENYQQEDGSIAIPEALQPYMGGVKYITTVV